MHCVNRNHIFLFNHSIFLPPKYSGQKKATKMLCVHSALVNYFKGRIQIPNGWVQTALTRCTLARVLAWSSNQVAVTFLPLTKNQHARTSLGLGNCPKTAEHLWVKHGIRVELLTHSEITKQHG